MLRWSVFVPRLSNVWTLRALLRSIFSRPLSLTSSPQPPTTHTQALSSSSSSPSSTTTASDSASSKQGGYFEIGLRHFKASLTPEGEKEGGKKGKEEALNRARQVWKLGAEQGLTNCQNALGGLYLKEKNLEQAEYYFRQAADGGHVRAATELGKLMWERVQRAIEAKQDHSAPSLEMVHYFSIGTRAAHPEAFWGLSICYDYGHGVAQCHDRARELLHASVSGNLPEALFRLGDHYRLGLGGIHPNPERALHFYGSAADLGYCPAQFNFGIMHLLGKGVVVNEDLGTKYIFLAGQQGHLGALYIMGDLLYHGKAGLPKKTDEAEKYFQQAAQGGNAEAITALSQYGMKPVAGKSVKK